MSETKRVFIGIPVAGAVKQALEPLVEEFQEKKFKVRWVPPENWHVTVVFIGSLDATATSRRLPIRPFRDSVALRNDRGEEEIVSPLSKVAEVDRVVEVVKEIELRKFTLQVKGLGQFPAHEGKREVVERRRGRMVKRHRKRRLSQLSPTKVVYVSLKGELQQLHELRKQLTEGLDAVGVSYDTKAFHPHLTIGWVKQSASQGERLEMAKLIERAYVFEYQPEWVVKRVNLYESVLSADGAEYRILESVKFKDTK